jgi:hypothetical protein
MAQCKYTKAPPLCDAIHIDLPMMMKERREACAARAQHGECARLCESCGFVPDF